MNAMPRPRVLHSFYWKIALSFIALEIVVLLGQGVMFSVLISQPGGPFAPANPNAAAAAIAASLGNALARQPDQDLRAALLRAAAGSPQAAFLVMRDGRVAGTSDQPLSPEIRRQSEAALAGVVPTASPGARPTGPVVNAPIQVDGRLIGLVILPPPPQRGVFSELTRLLSLPGTSVLVLAAAAAALVIFTPARRRLRSLEIAAERLGTGDLAARAPDQGHDEVARVSAAFNRMAAELSARTEALRASDELRRQMVADVSHELKTPLTAVVGYLDTLSMEEVTLDAGTRARYLATARHETTRLRRIVTDLLDLAKDENDVGTLNVRLFDLERLFDHVVRRHEHEAARRGVRLLTNVSGGADQLAADPDRIEQAIDNLVVNALRHTSAGGTIELRATSTPTGQRLSVIDSGEGIPPEHLAKIFERFYKVDSARTSGAAGSGIGLSIVKAIVTRHGGTITVSSQPGHTEFVIELPQRLVARTGPEGPGGGSRYESASANL
jgi:signal transduction histidine kinase